MAAVTKGTVPSGWVEVSAIIPCFRNGRSAARAVESVAAQAWRPREVIVVDDCSGDATVQMIEELGRKYAQGWVRIVRLPKNVGAASARNAGWALAKEQYLAFLDSDDTWHCNKIRIQLEWMRRHPSVAMTCHALPIAGSSSPTPPGHVPSFKTITRRRLLTSNVVLTPTVMIKRDAPFRFPEGQRYSEDYALWLSLVTSGLECARSDMELAFRYKHAFGEGGLSSHLIAMELAELGNFRRLHHQGRISSIELGIYGGLSIGKFIRRVAVTAMRAVR